MTPRRPRPPHPRPKGSPPDLAPSTPQPSTDHKEGSALEAAPIRGESVPSSGRAALPSRLRPRPSLGPGGGGGCTKPRRRALTGFNAAAATGPGAPGAGGLGWDAGAPGQPPDPVRGGWRRRAEHPGSALPAPAPHSPPRRGPRPGPGLQSRGGGCGEPRRRRRRQRQRPSPASARITHPSPRREAPVREGGARRVPGVSTRRPPRTRVVVVAVAVAAVELPASGLRWAITLFHTRPTHSGNGRSGGQCAGAWGRARSPALSPAPAPTRRSLTAQAPRTDNERGCAEGLPQAFPGPTAQACLQDLTGTMRRTPA